MAKKVKQGRCLHCRQLRDMRPDGKVLTHDWPPMCRSVCPGSGQLPVRDMIAFDTGIPDQDSLIEIEGYGSGHFVKTFENGDVLVHVGSVRVPGKTRWKYADGPVKAK